MYGIEKFRSDMGVRVFWLFNDFDIFGDFDDFGGFRVMWIFWITN